MIHQKRGTPVSLRNTRSVRARRYASALLALGITAGIGGMGGLRAARGEDNAQAVDPVNVSGAKTEMPAAAVPVPAVPAAPIANTQPVAPVAPETPVAAQPAVSPPTPAAETPAPAIVAPSPAAAVPAVAPSAPAVAAPAEAGGQAVSPVDVSKVPAAEAPTTSPTIVAPAVPAPAAVPAEAAPAVTQTPAPVAPAASGSETAPAAPEAPAAPAVAATPESAPATAPATAPTTGPTPPNIQSTASAIADDGKLFPCTGIQLSYRQDHPGEPAISDLLNTPIKLGVVSNGFVGPRPGVPVEIIKLGDIGKSEPRGIYRGGINAMYVQIIEEFHRRGLVGIFVVVDERDIGSGDTDLRADQTALRLTIVTSTVKHVRTLATGEGVKEGERVDNPRHAMIRKNSPLQGGPGRDDLLNKDVLDDYVLRLNRMPGRHVDVAVSGTGATKEDIGKVNLDYLVSESRPWYVYSQISNTGTAQTDEWRERFGFVDNQLTGHDDTLSLDYITAGFNESHAAIGSYELPVFGFDRMRYRIYGSWNKFTASDVGQAKEHFSGEEWTIGNEAIWNFFQHRDLFIDALGGFRFENIDTNNESVATKGHGSYFSPYAGLRLDRSTELASTTASATFVGYLTNSNKTELEGLDRKPVDSEPLIVQGDATQTFYLEPILDPKGFTDGQGTLAHEVYLHAHGQWAFDSRLVPQAEDVAGGFYTVRGYPESLLAGDSVFVLNAEYRLHIPRLFPMQPDPSKTPFLWDKSFRFAPQQAYGHPDWDLIGRSFIDVGRVMYSRHVDPERNGTLVGVGVGLELQYKQNLNIRVDWGTALNTIRSSDVTQSANEGSSRFHISATFLY